MTDYQTLNNSLRALVHDVPHKIANFSNSSAVLFDMLEDINWAGFYFLEGDKLILGPFQGKPACIEINIGRGVCGTAVQDGKTILVENVHEFPGHIACDSASNSEIVIPIRKDGIIIGVLDIDSPLLGRFTNEDKIGLEEFVSILEEEVL